LANTIRRGKLPISFDRAWEEYPLYSYYYPNSGTDTRPPVLENDHPEVDLTIGHVKYDDRLMVGYSY
jgi:hypothetical protein